MKNNQSFRDGKGFDLDLNRAQDDNLQQCLHGYKESYNTLTNNCHDSLIGGKNSTINKSKNVLLSPVSVSSITSTGFSGS